jgi:hypothetical protein
MDDFKYEIFKRILHDLESSSGKNTDHSEVQSGLHKGFKAQGEYGIMPLSALDYAKTDKDLKHLKEISGKDMQHVMETSPDFLKMVEDKMIHSVLDKQGGDLDKAVYSWHQGSANVPDKIDESSYKGKPNLEARMKRFKEILDPVTREIMAERTLSHKKIDSEF